ncbi:MAG: hypothetical protein LBD35_07685 [Prevotellaceae bacterium]|jgi:hypothetical protein|nr:hypothetical protein [Prevotellaceae bacterium]
MNCSSRALSFVGALFLSLWSSCSESDGHFAVSDAESLVKIELTEGGNNVALSKTESGEWFAGGFAANPTNMNNLKKILSGIEMQYPLPNMLDSIYPARRIAGEGLRLRAFGRNGLVRDFSLLFAGDDGTIALAAGGRQAYVVDYPGADIDLRDYLVAEPGFWENSLVFASPPHNIKRLKVEHTANPEDSFSIENTGDSILLFDANGKPAKYDEYTMSRYLSYFREARFERIMELDELDETKRRALLETEPMYTISLTASTASIASTNADTDTDIDTITCRLYPIADARTDDYGNPLVYDRDFFCLAIPQKSLFAKARWREFDILLKKLNDF